jgi:hypothetical protein
MAFGALAIFHIGVSLLWALPRRNLGFLAHALQGTRSCRLVPLQDSGKILDEFSVNRGAPKSQAAWA